MKNFHISYVFMLLLAIPALFISCNKDEDPKLDFEISVPDDWESVVYANEGFIYAAKRATESPSDSIVEALYIFKELLSENYTLHIYYSSLKRQIMATEAYDSLVYESDTIINDTDFKKMLSIEKLQYVNPFYKDTFYIDMLTTRYFFHENKAGYNMIFLSVDTAFRRNQLIFNDIMSTFHYKN